MTKEELLKKIDFEKNWLYECGIFGSDVDIAFHAIKKSVIEALEQEPCEDAVSRKAVINTLYEMDKVLNVDRTVEMYRDLLKECYKVLTPVNPQEPNTDRVEYGTDGNAYRLTISNGKEFEQEPKTGHWIDKFGGVYRCSECRELIELDCEITTPKSIERFRYCPNCGARMKDKTVFQNNFENTIDNVIH